MHPLIGLMGQKRSGKDTAAQALINHHGYTRFAFADPMKRAAYALNPIIGDVPLPGALTGVKRLQDIVDALGWEQAKECPEVRGTLQRLGTEVGRDIFGKSFWVDQTMRLVADQRRFSPVVITDVRFGNEADAILEVGGIMVRVDRPGLNDEDNHASEHAWRDIETRYVLLNDSSIEDLHAQVASIV